MKGTSLLQSTPLLHSLFLSLFSHLNPLPLPLFSYRALGSCLELRSSKQGFSPLDTGKALPKPQLGTSFLQPPSLLHPFPTPFFLSLFTSSTPLPSPPSDLTTLLVLCSVRFSSFNTRRDFPSCPLSAQVQSPFVNSAGIVLVAATCYKFVGDKYLECTHKATYCRDPTERFVH